MQRYHEMQCINIHNLFHIQAHNFEKEHTKTFVL